MKLVGQQASRLCSAETVRRASCLRSRSTCRACFKDGAKTLRNALRTAKVYPDECLQDRLPRPVLSSTPRFLVRARTYSRITSSTGVQERADAYMATRCIHARSSESRRCLKSNSASATICRLVLCDMLIVWHKERGGTFFIDLRSANESALTSAMTSS
jgi:hypothetical protein